MPVKYFQEEAIKNILNKKISKIEIHDSMNLQIYLNNNSCFIVWYLSIPDNLKEILDKKIDVVSTEFDLFEDDTQAYFIQLFIDNKIYEIAVAYKEDFYYVKEQNE